MKRSFFVGVAALLCATACAAAEPKAGLDDPGWRLVIDRGHYFADEVPSVEVVLAGCGAWAEGEATLSVTDDAGAQEWSATKKFAVSQERRDDLVSAFRGCVFANFKPGRHVLAARLSRGGSTSTREKAFWISDRPVAPKAPKGFFELHKGGEPKFPEAFARVADGATALVHLEEWRFDAAAPKGVPVEGLALRREALWHCRSAAVALPHAFTAGMPLGFCDEDWWTGCAAPCGFTAKAAPESTAMKNFSGNDPGARDVSLLLAVYRHGRGRIVLSTLPMDWNSPAGMLLKASVLKACGAQPGDEPALRAWACDRGVKLPNRRPGGWSGYRPRGVLAWECTVAGAIDPKSVAVRPACGATGTQGALVRGKDWEMDDKWGALGFVGPAEQNVAVDVSYAFNLQRLDSVVKAADGRTVLRYGAPRALMPTPPALAAGETRLTNFFWRAGTCEAYPVLETAGKAPVCASRAADSAPKTLRKLRNGEPVKILAWGDSVTACGFLADEFQWQEQFVRRLRAAFPKSKITLVSNGWGGRTTQAFLNEPKGSKYNYDETVLAVKPDLVVSEFVNDAGLSKEQFDKIYPKLRDDFRRIGAEWVALTPHYVRCDWMGLASMKGCDDDPRPYVRNLRAFCAANGVGLADASLRWGHLWREGVPHETLFVNNINHPNAEAMSFFADALMAYFTGSTGNPSCERTKR